MTILIPDLIYRDGRFEAGLALEFDDVTGTIVRIGPVAELTATDFDDVTSAPPAPATGSAAQASRIERLPGRALLPGFVNAHSHAFQRLIRGRTQWRPASAPGADFWSWRESMYMAALALTPDEVFDVSRACFLEMLRAGYTTVGEFHYLHRDPDGGRYDDPNELAHRVIAAADEVGIRIALLNVCYARGGIDRSLLPEQRRFATPDLEAFLSDTAALVDAYALNPRVTVGVAPHSIRAVPREWLPALHDWARSSDLPFHMHVSEQPAEVEAAVQAWGLRPVEVLAAEGVLDERFTAVHATHLTLEEIALLGDAGATVCACPTTERDLGDGFLPGAELLDASARIALGSDSQTVIDPFEEMRLIEYHERLRRLRRIVLAVPGGEDRLEVAPLLFELGTESGARSLRLDAGKLDDGMLADIVAIDLDHPVLAGWTPETLPAVLAFSAAADVVTDVWVGGVRRLEDRRHRLDREAVAAFREVAGRIL